MNRSLYINTDQLAAISQLVTEHQWFDLADHNNTGSVLLTYRVAQDGRFIEQRQVIIDRQGNPRAYAEKAL